MLICMALVLAIASYAYADQVDDLCQKAFESFTQNNADEAIRLYQEILTDYPDSKRCDDAQWGIASVYGGILRDPEKAYLARKELVEKYPDSKWADDAMYNMIIYWNAKAWKERKELDKDSKRDSSKLMELSKKTMQLSKRFLNNYAKSSLTPKAVFYGKIEIYRYFLKDYDKAIKEAKDIISKYPHYDETPGMYIVISYMYEEQMEQPDLTPAQRSELARSAEKWYKEFLKKHPNHEDAKEVKEALRSIRQTQNR